MKRNHIRFVLLLTISLCIGCQAPSPPDQFDQLGNFLSKNEDALRRLQAVSLLSPTPEARQTFQARRPTSIAIYFVGQITSPEQRLYEQFAEEEAFADVHLAGLGNFTPAKTPEWRGPLGLVALTTSMKTCERLLEIEAQRGTDYCLIVGTSALFRFLTDPSDLHLMLAVLVDLHEDKAVWYSVESKTDERAAGSILTQMLVAFRPATVKTTDEAFHDFD